MLKKLGSPRKGSRFVPSKSDATDMKELSALAESPIDAKSVPVDSSTNAVTSNEGDGKQKESISISPDSKKKRKSKFDFMSTKKEAASKPTPDTTDLPDTVNTHATTVLDEENKKTYDSTLISPTTTGATKSDGLIDDRPLDDGSKPTSQSKVGSTDKGTEKSATEGTSDLRDQINSKDKVEDTINADTKDTASSPSKSSPTRRMSLGLKNLTHWKDKAENKALPQTVDEKKERNEPKSQSTKDKDMAEAKENHKKETSKSNKGKERHELKKINTKHTDEEGDDDITGKLAKDKPKDQDDTFNTDAPLSPIRRKVKNRDPDSLVTSSVLSRRVTVPLNQPEVHIIGEIEGGEGFSLGRSDGVCCKWSIDYGNQWIHIAGDQLGQTQTDYSSSLNGDRVIWAHPLDLHFATSALHGWPKLLIQVWRVDTYMKMNVIGYGFTHLPFSPGHHELTIPLWRPMGSKKEELEAQFLGNTTELVTDEVLFNTAWAERCRLKTIASGKVHVQVGMILRNFHAASMDM